MAGWIKIHRKFLEWEWYNDIPCKVLALHLILSANFAESKCKGYLIKRGQLFTNKNILANETGLSMKQIRRAVEILETGRFLGSERAGKDTIITICNYDSYQCSEIQSGQEEGRKKAGKGQQVGQGKGRTIYKEEKEEYINPPIIPHGGYESFDFNFLAPEFEETFFMWIDYKSKKGKKYKSQKSIELCYKKLIKLSDNSPDKAREIVEESMSNNWDGLFELKNNEKSNEKNRINYTSKQSVNEYAMQQFITGRERREKGVVVEVERPF